MCWFLHSTLRGDVDEDALRAINDRHFCRIARGTRHDLKMAVLEDVWDYRVTKNYCDCECGIGRNDPNDGEVVDLAALIAEVAALPGAKTLHLSMTWACTRNKHEESLKLSALDLRQWLADLKYSTLYTIDLEK